MVSVCELYLELVSELETISEREGGVIPGLASSRRVAASESVRSSLRAGWAVHRGGPTGGSPCAWGGRGGRLAPVNGEGSMCSCRTAVRSPCPQERFCGTAFQPRVGSHWRLSFILCFFFVLPSFFPFSRFFCNRERRSLTKQPARPRARPLRQRPR